MGESDEAQRREWLFCLRAWERPKEKVTFKLGLLR